MVPEALVLLVLRAGAAAILPTAVTGPAQVEASRYAAAPVEMLKEAYLLCEDEAVRGGLGGSATMECSSIYEELKLRAFGGDFKALRAWSDELRARPAERTR